MVAASRVAVPRPESTLDSLPNELLLWTFESLDDRELYCLGLLCRRFNVLALPILIDRHLPKARRYHTPGDFYLASVYDPILYAAIRVAIFITYIERLSVTLQPSSPGQLLMLADIIKSKTYLHNLSLHLRARGFSRDMSQEEQERMLETSSSELQRLLNVAVNKGCSSLRVSGFWKTRRDRMHMASNRAQLQLQMALSQSQTNQGGSRISSDVKKATTTPKLATVYPNPTKLTSFAIDSVIFFQKDWHNWTLHLCNIAPLTSVSITSTGFKSSDWDQLLPRLHMQWLTDFSIHGPVSNSQNLALFLQRHATTLDTLSIRTSDDPYQGYRNLIHMLTSSNVQTSDHDDESGGGGDIIIYHLAVFNFPKLLVLTVGDMDAYWFITSVLNALPFDGSRPYLPNLRQINLRASSPSPSNPDSHLNKALNALCELVTRVVEVDGLALDRIHRSDPFWDACPRNLDPYWFNSLHITWSHPPDEVLGWLKTQIAPLSNSDHASSSPLSDLVCIRSLEIEGKRSTFTNADILEVLPHFLSRFSGMRSLTIQELNLEKMKELSKAGYWKGVKELCPVLEKCVFEIGRQVSMDKLVSGNWTEKTRVRNIGGPLAPLLELAMFLGLYEDSEYECDI